MNDTSYKTALQNALQEHRAGNLDLAEKSYQDILKITPQKTTAFTLHLLSATHNNLAYLLQSRGIFDKAIHHYKMSLENNANNVLAHHNLGAILANEGKHEEAISHFKNVLELQPEHIESLHNLGSIFLLQKKPTEALPYFFRLAQLTQDFDVYYNLGVIYMDLARFDDAIIYFCEAMKIRPDDFATYVNLGTIYLRRQNFIEAEKYYNQAHRLQPNNQETSYILAVLQQKDNIQKAPAEYVKHLFDQYAPYFEQHLKLLNCQVSQLLFDNVQTIIDSKTCDCSLRILDLGCGTGMCGSKFKPIAQELIGVDLSERMLDLPTSALFVPELS